MPTNPPPKPDLTHELNDRRIAEFALEESRLSNVAYRFQLSPRDRVWKDWDRTEFEPNRYRVIGLAGICLLRDEAGDAQKVASRALGDVDDVLYTVERPAQAVIVRGAGGTSEIINRPTLCAEIIAPDSPAFNRALAALDSAFPGGRVAGKILSEDESRAG
ncbi:MAG TPA: hypothetical protein VGK86_08235 [Thermoanaerobaculia bacterium]|jgi:hypothetical protein